MKIFPKKVYSVRLKKDIENVLPKLKNQTLSKEQYVSDWNNQVFIGNISSSEFEVKVSKKLYGEFCVFKGKFNNEKGLIEIQTSKLIKTGFILMAIFVFSGIITAIFQNEYKALLLIALTPIVLKYTFLDNGFRIVSEIGLKKLIEILDITEITENTNQSTK
jgi:hypothetical protein